MSIQFPTSTIQPYQGALPAVPVKGIGNGSLAATANIDFTQYTLVPISNGATYAASYLDFSNTGGVSNRLDSIRSVIVDNMEGVSTTSPVYIVCPDTGDTFVCPSNSRIVCRVTTNIIQLYAYQLSPGLGTVRVIACNYDVQGEFSISEYVAGPSGNAIDRIAGLSIIAAFTGTSSIQTLPEGNVFVAYVLISFQRVSIGADAVLKYVATGEVLWESYLLKDVDTIRVDMNRFFNTIAGNPPIFELDITFPNTFPSTSILVASILFYGQSY